jgi:alpha-glucosidase
LILRRIYLPRWPFLLLSLLLATNASLPLRAQTLAHKGWVGSGLTIDAWWKNATFYQLDPLRFAGVDSPGALAGVSSHLDYLQSLDVDAVILSPLPLLPPGAGRPPFEQAYGTTDDLDHLEQQASLHKLRLIADLPISANVSSDAMLGAARFWLSRGVGGLRLIAGSGDPPADLPERVRLLRKLCAGFVGDRVLIWDLPSSATGTVDAATPSSRRAAPRNATAASAQLTVDHRAAELSALDAGALRQLVSGAVSPNAQLAGRTKEQPKSLPEAKILATALLAGGEAPLLSSGQELGGDLPGNASAAMPWPGAAGLPSVATEDADPDSLLNWYRKLSGLRHAGSALRDGSVTMMDTGYPDVVAWVRRSKTAGENPILVVCNLTGHAVVLSLRAQLESLGMKAGSGIVPLALSFRGVNPSFTASGIALPAGGVYLGQILQPGLEDAPALAVSHRRGR